MKPSALVCRPDDMHPYECLGPGKCVHCDQTVTTAHDPNRCALCDDGPTGMAVRAGYLPDDHAAFEMPAFDPEP